MQTIKRWLRKWLGVEEDAALRKCFRDNLELFSAQNEQLIALEKAQRDTAIKDSFQRSIDAIRQAILKSQGFVPLMNDRIAALEQTSVTGAGAEAIVVGVMEAYDQKAKRYFARIDQEMEVLTREIEELKVIVVKQEMKPKQKEPEKKPEVRRRTWPQQRAAIEREEAQKAEAESRRPNVA